MATLAEEHQEGTVVLLRTTEEVNNVFVFFYAFTTGNPCLGKNYLKLVRADFGARTGLAPLQLKTPVWVKVTWN